MFWSHWPTEYKRMYQLSLGIVLASIVYYIWGFFTFDQLGIQWLEKPELDVLRMPFKSFNQGFLDLSVEADRYLSVIPFAAGSIQIPISLPWITFFLISFAWILALSSISYIRSWYYYFTITLFSVYLVSLRVEVLELFGFTSSALVVLPIILFCGVTYFFNYFASSTSFLTRLFAIAGLWIAFFSICHFFGKTTDIAMHAVNYGMSACILLVLLFFIVISFEIVYGFLSLITYTKSVDGRYQSLHFVIVFLLYFLNIVLVYLHNIRQIDWDIVYITPFALPLVSFVLGIQGFRERSFLFERQLPFAPFGAFIYLSLAILSFTCLAYAFKSANDPLVEMFEDGILYTHIGMGMAFFMFVMTRYAQWMNVSLPVNKVIYRVQGFPFLAVAGVGVLVFFSLFLYARMFPYYQAIAGYFNGVADVYKQQNDLFYAEEYYQHALGYEYQNHKSNYELANLYAKVGRAKQGLSYLRFATKKQPSPYAYINLSNAAFYNQQPINAIQDIKEGLIAFPENPFLLNNLALIFNRLHMPDSAIYYVQKAISIQPKPAFVSNFLAILAMNQIKIKESELTKLVQTHAVSPAVLGNAKVIAEQMQFTLSIPSISLTDKNKLEYPEFVYLYNIGLQKASEGDSVYLHSIEPLFRLDTNLKYKEDFSFLKALTYYYAGAPAKAAEEIDRLQMSGTKDPGFYLNTLGLWMLEKNAPAMAAQFFEMSNQRGNDQALFHFGMANAEQKETDRAMQAFQKWSSIQKDSSALELVKHWQWVLTTNQINDVYKAPEALRYAFLHYRKSELLEIDLLSLFQSFQTYVFKTKAGIELISYLYGKGLDARAEQIIQVLESGELKATEIRAIARLKLLKAYRENPVSLSIASTGFTELQEVFNKLKLNPKSQIPALEQLGQKYAFDPELLEIVVRHLATTCRQPLLAYQCAEKALRLNQKHPAALKTYVLAATWFGIPSFAASAYEEWAQMANPAEIKSFQTIKAQAQQDFLKGL